MGRGVYSASARRTFGLFGPQDFVHGRLFHPVLRRRVQAGPPAGFAHAYHTPLLTSRLLSERTGFEVRLKAEMFQRTGSYKLRGP
jgi:hypothetical protein